LVKARHFDHKAMFGKDILAFRRWRDEPPLRQLASEDE